MPCRRAETVFPPRCDANQHSSVSNVDHMKYSRYMQAMKGTYVVGRGRARDVPARMGIVVAVAEVMDGKGDGVESSLFDSGWDRQDACEPGSGCRQVGHSGNGGRQKSWPLQSAARI